MAKPLTKKKILEMLQVAEELAFSRLRVARKFASEGDEYYTDEILARKQEAWETCNRLYKTAMGEE